MIDDDFANYEILKKYGIKTILFDDKNMYPDVEERVSSWSDIEYILGNLE